MPTQRGDVVTRLFFVYLDLLGVEVMRYENIEKAIFRFRPNRFVAHVEFGGQDVVCHVKNTGRCRELLVPGATVYLQRAANQERKTPYDLVAVEKGELLVNMDSQAPNQVFREWAERGGFRPGLTQLRPETVYGDSRFDFYWEDEKGLRGFVEVKGCTLEHEGHARFPDAPTDRGVKHLEELVRAKGAGYEAAVCFVLQMAPMKDFSPNDETHPAFGDALRRARAAGVEVLAMECRVGRDSLEIWRPVSILL